MTPEALLASLPPPDSDQEGRHRLCPLPAGALSLTDMVADDEALAVAVAAQASQARGGDSKLGCAYLIGSVAWEAGRLFGGLWLAGWHLRHVDPAAVALSLRAVPWEEDGENGIAQVIDLTVDPAGLCAGPDDPGHLASAFVHLHESLIAALSRMSGLGPAAQWRLVADGLTAALLGRGKELGKAERAVALGSAILRDRRTKLGSRQGEFVLVDLPPDHAEWFRLRSGCCRYYTSEGGDYCTTCVHRNRDDQIHRLRAYLARRAAAA